jgi:large subunit ribosomal protein L29
MTINEIREKETPQLHHDLIERRKHLFELRSQAVTEKLEDPSQLRKTRKEIARILTTLRQREVAPVKKGPSVPKPSVDVDAKAEAKA